jgi:hypothetical protein
MFKCFGKSFLNIVKMTRILFTYGGIFSQSFDKDSRKAITVVKQRSAIPVILRDMAPPEGSIFDPVKKWEEEKVRRPATLAEIKKKRKA